MHHEATPNVVAFKKNDESFTYLVRRPKQHWDDDVPDPGATTYPGARHGPEPTPEWVITSGDARDEELGTLKSGKEADVALVERTFGDARNLLAAKRYRDTDHRTFRNDAAYRMGKEPRDGRVGRAIKKQTNFGSAARAGVWAQAEFETLGRLWESGIPVPYPVQLSGTEIMLEYLGDDDGAAPRLAESRPGRELLEHLRDQAVAILWGLAGAGVVHGDLSSYNTLVWGETLYVIDVPQAAELTDVTRAAQYNSNALDFLQRDCRNLLGWFQKKGAETPDPDTLFGELVAAAFAPRST
ncbi:MAG TPA: RIO1 family regulatory kinase/ATPase [Acidimicrobiales bacterium]|nr:RIO1 family regulatory kinase/ATPase [Acidimicrobiales bacterium]